MTQSANQDQIPGLEFHDISKELHPLLEKFYEGVKEYINSKIDNYPIYYKKSYLKSYDHILPLLIKDMPREFYEDLKKTLESTDDFEELSAIAFGELEKFCETIIIARLNAPLITYVRSVLKSLHIFFDGDEDLIKYVLAESDKVVSEVTMSIFYQKLVKPEIENSQPKKPTFKLLLD